MRKVILTFLFTCSVLYFYAQSIELSTYPYFNSMFDARNSGLYKFNSTNNSIPQGIDGLPVQQKTIGTKLTTYNSGGNQTTGGYFTGIAFNPDKGIIISFDYSIDGGTEPYDGGFSVNLLNGKTLDNGSVSTDGYVVNNGYTLGYSYNRALNAYMPGFTAGFLSFGFDPSRKYKKMLYTDQDWVTGINFDSSNPAPETGGDITIRGPWNPDFKIPVFSGSPAQANYGGYPVLISQNVTESTPNNPTFSPRYTIDPQTGNYTVSRDQKFTGFTGIRGAIRTFGIENNDRRKAVCSLVIGTNEKGVKGYFLSVVIYHGLTPTSIIKDFFIDPNTKLNYQEMIAQYSWSDKTILPTEIQQLSLELPKKLILAFSGSTSSLLNSQNSIIRNLDVYLPFSPNTNDIVVDNVCISSGKKKIINVLKNVTGYNSNDYNLQTGVPVASEEYLDKKSFTFLTFYDGKYTGVTDRYKFTSPHGVYDYDPDTGYIVFTSNGSSGYTPELDILHFNINNKATDGTTNMGDDMFRSRIAKVEIRFLTPDACPPDMYVIMNQHVAPVIIK